jgi:predicted RNA-binding Zn ribbon-like protein
VAAFTIESHQFAARDFVGGDAALDFINTVSGRDQTPRDWLDSYARLLEWATLVRLLPEKNIRALTKKMHGEPAAATRALTRAKELREELFALVTAMAAGNAPPKSALATLREHWLAGTEAHELRFENGQVTADIRADAADFDLIAAIVAYRMIEHVMPQPVDRLRVCAGANCAWVFIDSSKAGRRRWCDMAVCGNVAKAQRFYARSRRRAASRS